MITHDFIGYINHALDYSLYCAAQPQGWIGCNKFWAFFYLSLMLLMFLVCVYLIRKIIIDKREYKAYLKKKADREKIAPPEVMQNYLWRADIE